MKHEEIEEAYRRHGRDVWRFVASLTRDTHQADDILQNLFLKLAERLRSGDLAVREIRPFLFRSAQNAVVDVGRRSSAEQRLATHVGQALSYRETHGADRPDVHAIVAGAIDHAALTETQRSLLRYRLYARMPMDEIALVLGISRRSAYREFQRCLVHMRRHLESHGVSPEDLP